MVAIAAYIAASRGSRRDVPRRLRQPVTRCSQMRQLRPAHEVCSASCRSPKIGSVHAITFLRGWNGAPRLQLRYIVPGGLLLQVVQVVQVVRSMIGSRGTNFSGAYI